jgi:hypothetical protein
MALAHCNVFYCYSSQGCALHVISVRAKRGLLDVIPSELPKEEILLVFDALGRSLCKQLCQFIHGRMVPSVRRE